MSSAGTYEVRCFEPNEWLTYRALRLRALLDAPDAFGSSFAVEEIRPLEEWERRLAGAARSGTDLPLVGLVNRVPAGLAWAKVDATDPSHVNLFQMWVAPEYRGSGLGRRLLETAVPWARARGAAVMRLGVTIADSPAMRLYRNAGFAPSGSPEPLRPGSDLLAQPMVLHLR